MNYMPTRQIEQKEGRILIAPIQDVITVSCWERWKVSGEKDGLGIVLRHNF